ncbi:MAG TPA: acetyl-CoA hydrolase/transferase C-terminal domain-containing protein [Microthrixaceae bacterium]|nr:acetyl-CoA hydrolase/transferase C-terminal domain-containing protein [Microthrixaceae bacterium]
MAPSEREVEDVAALVRPVDTLGLPLGPGQPVELIHALGARTDWQDLRVLCAMFVDLYELPARDGVTTTSTFFGPAERLARDAGTEIEFIPADFRRWAGIFEARAPRVMATVATPPDGDGWCSLSLHAGATVDELHRAGADPDRLLVVELNDAFPRTAGTDAHPHRLHLDEVDAVYRSSRAPVVLEDGPVGDVERTIAEHARAFVPDGSTLQTGFGAIPSTIASMLADGDGGDYGIHSEMFTTGLMRLHRAGKVTNGRKAHHFAGRSVSTFAAGTDELYAWLDDNSEVAFVPVSAVNDPEVIAANPGMVAINGAIAVDLAGQIVADTIAGEQFSGIGGHEDFLAGTGLQLEDRSLVCLPSARVVAGTRVSRIVAQLDPGWIVTTPRHQVDVVITEHGVAELRGRTTRERAVALAAIADPTVRDALMATAVTLR